MRRLTSTVIGTTLALVLAACTTPQAATPTEPPRPTRAPEPTPRPTRAPTTPPRPTERPTSAALSLAEVEVGSLDDYIHPTGAFSIQVPTDWTIEEETDSDAGQIFWSCTDPTENAIWVVTLAEETGQLGNDVLTTRLTDFVEGAFGSEAAFDSSDIQEQNDGSLRQTFLYETDVQGLTVEMLGNTFIEQRGNFVSLITFIVPQEQFDRLEADLSAILNSYRIDTSATISGGSPVTTLVDLSDLTMFNHSTGVFRAQYPSSWTVNDLSSPGQAFVTFTDPGGNGSMLVLVLPAGGTTYSAQQLTDLLKQTLDTAFGSEDNYDISDPETQSDGSIRFIFTYNNTDGVLLLGNSFVEQRGDLLAISTIVVPDAEFDDLQEGLGTIINSIKFDPSNRP